MALIQVAPLKFFESVQVDESLTIRLRYCPQLYRLDIVFALVSISDDENHSGEIHGPQQSPQRAGRSILWTRFAEVGSIETKLGPNKVFCDERTTEVGWQEHEDALIRKRPCVVYEFECLQTGNGYVASGSFSSFGSLSWSFTSLYIAWKVLIAESTCENRWLYKDQETGEVVDFFNPFPEVDHS